MTTGVDRRIPAGPIVALSSALALGTMMLLGPLLRSVVPATELPDPLPDHHQDAETLLFVLAFGVVLPAALLVAWRAAAKVGSGPNAASFSSATALLSALLIVVLLAGRLTSEAGLAVGGALWLAAAAATLLALASSRAVRLPDPAILWIGVAALAACVALAFTTLGSISVPILILGLIATAGAVVLSERVELPAPARGVGIAADVAVPVLLALAVPNLVIFTAGGGAAGAVDNTIIQFHQNFFLGPANQVLAGDAMLVETLSQYGVGSIYFLAGVFAVVPIGNASLGLVEGGLSVLMFAGVWAAMRAAGVTRLLAAAAMTVAVVALVYGLVYPLGGLLQHGAIRFGMPVGIVLGAVIEARWPARATAGRLLQLATLALASIWALEAFAYTVITLAAVVAVQIWLTAAGGRRAEALRWLVQAAAACVIAHVLLALGTLIAAGELPDWGWYLNTLREFLFGQIGDLTYDFSAWSPGIALGALYLVSAAALVVLLGRRPDVVAHQRPLVIAIAAMTGFGIALFTYIVNRSADHIVAYVALPAVALGALWITLIDRPVLGAPRAARRVALGAGLGVSALLVAVSASSVSERWNESALAIARPGGTSLSATLDRIFDPAPLRPQTADGEQLLESEMPGEERSAVLTSADTSVEILIRTERGNAVPLGDPWEDSFVPEDHLEPLGAWIDTLEPGARLLIDAPARESFELSRDDPDRDPLATPAGGVSLVPSGMAVLQEWVLKEIGQRYDLEVVATSPSGVEVVELVPRRPAA
jgi:hypothetical protein